MKTNTSIKRARRHLTAPNLIASLALFIALGGVSWAAATAPKNSVATKSIKKNAVTNAKIKNNAVTGRKIKSNSVLSSDVKNDALTGDDVNEGTLGQVPSAAAAADMVNVVTTGVSTASNSDPNVARSQAAEVPLASHGAISIYGKCFTDSDTNEVYYETIARTTSNGAGMYGYSVSDNIYEDPALNTNTAEGDRQAQSDYAPNNTVDGDYSSGVSVLGPDGKGLMFDITTYGRAGNPTDPFALLPAGNSCAWHLSGAKVR